MPFSDVIRRFLPARSHPVAPPAHAIGPAEPAVRAIEPVVAADEERPTAALEPDIPHGLTVAAGYAWRLLLLGVLVVALYQVFAYFSAATVPLAMAILLAALLHPAVVKLRQWGWTPAAASGVSLVGLLVLIGGVLTLVGAQVAGQWPSLVDQSLDGFESLLGWLASGPLHIDQTQLDSLVGQARDWVSRSSSVLAGYAATASLAFGGFVAGTFTALIAAFFLVFQGERIFLAVARALVPGAHRERLVVSATKGWTSLVSYMRTIVIVAAVDATGIAVGAYILGLPLVAALFALTFFASFIPIVGAVAAGGVAVLLALVTNGWVSSLIMLGIVVAVQQLEGNVLQPLLMGKAVDLHPLLVLFGLTAGAVISGILGALLSIPVVAFAAAFIRAWSNQPDPERRRPPSLPRRARRVARSAEA